VAIIYRSFQAQAAERAFAQAGIAHAFGADSTVRRGQQ
jgi:hypothetical protein